MQLVHLQTIEECRNWRNNLAAGKNQLAFVPTMGALHEGHMSLVNKAKQDCANVIVSIFVNPLQFGPNEDFSKYPRPLEADLALCEKAGVKAVFNPSPQEIYPAEDTTRVIAPTSLTDRLCGLQRPGHFSGVTTVVSKLFSIIQPDKSYFGEKDFQQLTIIKKMVRDLNFATEIVACPTVREADGLALSSRNVYLGEKERKEAVCLYQTLCFVRDSIIDRKISPAAAIAAGKGMLGEVFTLDYLEVCNPETLLPLKETQLPLVILAAVKLGNVRLIDNLLVSK